MSGASMDSSPNPPKCNCFGCSYLKMLLLLLARLSLTFRLACDDAPFVQFLLLPGGDDDQDDDEEDDDGGSGIK